jgi:geranylgeranyl pyrophosphate synthase
MKEILDLMKTKMDNDHYQKFIYTFSSGKRIRPTLMKNACSYLKKDFSPLVDAAAAIEVMHCMSLAHDDIIDKAEERRGMTPFYKKFGTNSAVLFGDLFATLSMEMLAEKYNKEIYLEFLRSLNNMIKGQIMEIENKVIDIESYLTYAEKKTSSLFVLCAKAPLLYYNMKDDKLVKFAQEFGILYQIVNDMNGKGNSEIGILNFVSEKDAKERASETMSNLQNMNIGVMETILESIN